MVEMTAAKMAAIGKAPPAQREAEQHRKQCEGEFGVDALLHPLREIETLRRVL
jgi:hypothetical protein